MKFTWRLSNVQFRCHNYFQSPKKLCKESSLSVNLFSGQPCTYLRGAHKSLSTRPRVRRGISFPQTHVTPLGLNAPNPPSRFTCCPDSSGFFNPEYPASNNNYEHPSYTFDMSCDFKGRGLRSQRIYRNCDTPSLQKCHTGKASQLTKIKKAVSEELPQDGFSILSRKQCAT